MAVDYRVNPLGGFDFGQAVGQIGQAYTAGQERKRQQEAMDEATQLFRSGTPLEQAEFMMRNPELRNTLLGAQQFQSDQTRMARSSGARRILMGEDPQTVISETAEAITAAGGDPRDTLALANRTPEEIQKIAYYQLSLDNPQAAKAFAEATGMGAKKAEGFTLSEGQGRYDAQGNLMAYMPKKVDTLDKELKADKDRFDRAAKLRSEVDKVSKVYRDVEDSYGRIQAAVSEAPSGASDMALIFNYMKMLDPGSTVREGEFATASQTGGLPAQVVNAYNKAVDGQMLTPKQRDDFISQATAQFNNATDKQLDRLSDYESLADRYGLERSEVIISEPARAESPLAALPQGTVDNGDGTFTLPDGRKVRQK